MSGELEFFLWLVGIIFVGLPAVMVGIPCLTAIILAWRCDR